MVPSNLLLFLLKVISHFFSFFSFADLKLHLASTDYGNFLQNEPSPLATTTIAEKCTEKMVEEFKYLRAHAVEPLATFLDYITYSYMIDNVILLITGTLHERDTHELIDKCHPLGLFEAMATLCLASNTQELFNSVLVDTPLGQFTLLSPPCPKTSTNKPNQHYLLPSILLCLLPV